MRIYNFLKTVWFLFFYSFEIKSTIVIPESNLLQFQQDSRDFGAIKIEKNPAFSEIVRGSIEKFLPIKQLVIGSVIGIGISAFGIGVWKIFKRKQPFFAKSQMACWEWYIDKTCGKKALLHHAAENNRLKIIENLLKIGTDMNLADEEGYTALHFAAQNGHEAIINFLLNHQADINARTKKNATPLHLAIKNEQFSIFLQLIERGANIDAQDQEGCTPLHWSILSKNKDFFEFLLRKKANLNLKTIKKELPIHWAAQYNQQEMLEKLFKFIPDINVQDARGRSLLYWAIYNDNEPLIDFLLEKNVNLDIQTDDNITPLTLAAMLDQKKTLKKIIKKKYLDKYKYLK